MITLDYCKTYFRANGKIVSESYLFIVHHQRQATAKGAYGSSIKGGRVNLIKGFFPPNQRINGYVFSGRSSWSLSTHKRL